MVDENKLSKSPYKENNVVAFPYMVIENNSAHRSSSKEDIMQRFFIEIAKLELLCDEAPNLSTDTIQGAIAKRADALKVVWFNMRFSK